MPLKKLKKPIRDLIERERVSRVATTGDARMPHVVPVCHVVWGGKIYFASGNDGRKVLNLTENPRVAISVDTYSDAWSNRGVMIQGTAKLIERGPRFRKFRALLYRKYPQYPSEAALGERDSVIVEVSPTRIFSWGFD